MVRSRLFWKLFAGFVALNLVLTLALSRMTWGWREQGARRLSESELRSAAAVLAELAPGWLAAPQDPGVKSQARRIAESYSAEIGLVDGEGQLVLCEPATGKRLGAATPESRQALRRGEVFRPAPLGSSDPGAADVFALRVGPADGPLGAVRITRSADRSGGELAGFGRLIGFYLVGATTLILAAGYALARHVVGPVRSLNRAALAMAGGDYAQRAFVANRDELGTLARSFNRMSKELGRQLTELRESDRRQATVLGGMIEGVIAIDARLRVLFANAAAGRLFGFLPPQVEGRPLLEAVRNHPLHEAAGAAIQSRAPQRLEVEWEERQLSVQVTPLVGQPTAGAIVVLHDTTELRRLESLRRDFVANVSHELKTPLSSIKAYTETLQAGAADDPQTRVGFLARIAEQAERLDALIRDLLSLARIESAQQPFEIQSVALEEQIGASLGDFQTRAESKRLLLRAEPPAERVLVKADPDGLRTILVNLVDNAVKYTPDGGSVVVRWRREGAMARIEVSDTGMGIPEGKAARVFERFYRVDEARSRDAGGTGLGLSIVKHLAQSFGGDVSVESILGRGSTFAVILPAG